MEKAQNQLPILPPHGEEDSLFNFFLLLATTCFAAYMAFIAFDVAGINLTDSQSPAWVRELSMTMEILSFIAVGFLVFATFIGITLFAGNSSFFSVCLSLLAIFIVVYVTSIFVTLIHKKLSPKPQLLVRSFLSVAVAGALSLIFPGIIFFLPTLRPLLLPIE